MRRSSVFLGVLGFLALAVGCGDAAEGEPECATGETDCSGVCVETDTDAFNCGACGTVCLDGEACDGGTCAFSCQTGLINCDGTCVDPATDDTYCGASDDCQGGNAGTTCANDEACDGGTCALSCQTGLIDCDGTCVDPATDDTY
ncbi:MAG: hypothetical protein JRE82_15780, partial [Deltaproteobacteria bacterium]|nr:hypothetical protein [Deltaproteobacteria bacterium]